MKRSLLVIIIWLIAASLVNGVQAAEAKTIKVYINQQEQKYDVQPILRNNTVFVPIRSIITSFGGDIAYHAATKTITAINGYDTFSIQLNSTKAIVNGIETELKQPPIAIGGYTYVPLRFIGETFGAIVNWNKVDYAVEILYKAQHTANDDQQINTKNEAEAFNELINLVEKYPENIDFYAAYVLLEKRNINFLTYVMNHGAIATNAIQYALAAGHVQATQYLLENYLTEIENKHRFNDYQTLFSYTLPEASSQYYVYLNPNSIYYKTYSPKILLNTSEQLVHLLVKHGLEPSSPDLVNAISHYDTVYTSYLQILIQAGADVNGISTESIIIDENEQSIHFTLVGDMTFSKDLVPIVELAYRVTTSNPSDNNLKKFSILVDAGANIEVLSTKQLTRLQYLYEGNKQYESLYSLITNHLQTH